jgi:PAS domain S-box-containing protein
MTGLPTIVVVDDAAEVRTLVRSRLRVSGRLDVVGEGASGLEAVELAERLQPDLMLLDVSMPGMDGLEALPRVRAVSPDTCVVMYSGFAEDGLSERCLALGAAAFFEKSTSLETLADDLRDVLRQDSPGSRRSQATGAPPVPAGPVDEGQAVLHEHLERFQQVFEEAAIGMATVTLSGGVVRCNRKLGALLGRTQEELVGAPYAELAGEDEGRLRSALREVVSNGVDLVRLEHDVVGPGVERRVQSTLTPVRDTAGRPLYLFLQVQEVSEHGESVVEVLRLLVDAVQDYAIFMLDPDGRVSTWNPGAQRSKGWTAEEIVGQHFRIFYPPEKQVERHPEHELEIALAEGRYEEEGWRVRKDGSRFWAHVTITAVRDRDGQLVGFGKVTRDDTARREAGTRLEEANVRLLAAAEEQSHFLSMTAHELRSPVGVLGGTAKLLRDHWADLGDDERTELLDGMAGSAGRLGRLLADLLTASRIQGSALDLKVRELRIDEELAGIVRTASRTAERGDVHLGPMPEVTVLADADRLAQMIENLVTNAMTYGAPPIEVTVEPAGSTVEIVVRDAGAGISEEMQQRLFERFATSSQGGTGLGLFIVRELARAQGGDASYRPGDAAFVISLPVADGGV